MPASEETYRKLPALHVAFAISSVAMAVVVVWMILADHLRPWKETQREFFRIETAKLRADEQAKLQEQQRKSGPKLQAIEARRVAVQQRAAENGRKVRDQEQAISRLKGAVEGLDTETKFMKAELDSRRSFYDGFIDRDERRQAAEYLTAAIIPIERDYRRKSLAFEQARRRLQRAELALALLKSNSGEVADDPAPGTPAAAAGFKAGDELAVADFEGLLGQVEQGQSAGGRGQVTVTRAGGPQTLAVGIPQHATAEDASADQAALDAWNDFGLRVTPVTDEVLKKRQEDLTRERDRISRALEQKGQQYGDGTVSGALAWLRSLPLIDLAAPPEKIQQISLPELTINYNFKDVPRYDRCTTCHLGIDRLGYDEHARLAQGSDGRPQFLTAEQVYAAKQPSAGKEPSAGEKRIPAVYRSHPHLTDGAMALDPSGKPTKVGLYLDANGPHPINNFGCTICHGGQGSGTSFTFSSHEPDTIHEREHWEKEHGWYEMHHWDEPMLPERFLQSSCIKCHHQVTDLNEEQAPKLLAGYKRITRYGCTGCHTIGGEGSFGPDLTDNRQTGPNLKHVGAKVSRDWLVKWIANPHAFRPDSRMPRFFGLSNNNSPEDWAKNYAEVHSIAHYLATRSSEPQSFVDPPADGDSERGRTLFLQKGCLACHSNRPYAAADLPKSLNAKLNPSYAVDAGKLYPPDSFPEGVRDYAKAEFGPNLSSMAAKFESREKGYRWLANWIKAPEAYHPKSLMPNLQLDFKDAADLASYILSTRADWKPEAADGLWPVKLDVPDVRVRDAKKPAGRDNGDNEVGRGLKELAKLYLSKAKVYNKRTILLSEVDETVDALSKGELLDYVGNKTIGRLGCFGCHNIPGFEDAKPIGTPLNGWGFKSPAKLDFGHIAEYLTDNPDKVEPTEEKSYDGTPELYAEKLLEHNRQGFLYQKLHRPRSYDYRKAREDLKSWDDRLRMPQFSWADDEEAVEEVMTFVLGLTGERIPAKYLPKYAPAKAAVAQGERLLERYNCRGCHVLKMPEFTIARETAVTAALPSFADNARAAFDNRSKDYLKTFYPNLNWDEKIQGIALAETVQAKGGKLVQVDAEKNETEIDPKATLILPADDRTGPITLSGMPVAFDNEDPDHPQVVVDLWQPVTIRGFTFNAGDRVILDPRRVKKSEADGGDFAWLYAAHVAKDDPGQYGPTWNRLPPPLIREGLKVQTPWLTAFFLDPYKIRPAANLRMPRFHYGVTPGELAPDGGSGTASGGAEARQSPAAETRDLANYFAGRDGAEFPYQVVPQRDQGYLSQVAAKLGGDDAVGSYLAAGWSIITKNQCVQCHAIGNIKPSGGEQVVNGPDLRQVAGRIRPGYMLEWIANPVRLVPYTAMPQVIPPRAPKDSPPTPGVPKGLEGQPLEQVRAMRDTLLNYVTAVEGQLASAPAPAAGQGQSPGAQPPKPGAEATKGAAKPGAE